jgi:Zn-dependent protease with chaperone function
MEKISSGFYLGMAALFTIPIAMVFLSLTMGYRATRWTNIILPAAFFVINIIGLPTYPSLYDQFLNAVGLVFNLLTIRYAWTWRQGDA